MSSSSVAPLSASAFGVGIRKILLLDAATCLAMGLLLMAAAQYLAEPLGLPKNFIFWAGIALLPCAALMALTSRLGSAPKPPIAMTWLVIVGNAGWILASVLCITVWFSPTPLGAVLVGAQAVVVAVLAVLELRAR